MHPPRSRPVRAYSCCSAPPYAAGVTRGDGGTWEWDGGLIAPSRVMSSSFLSVITCCSRRTLRHAASFTLGFAGACVMVRK